MTNKYKPGTWVWTYLDKKVVKMYVLRVIITIDNISYQLTKEKEYGYVNPYNSEMRKEKSVAKNKKDLKPYEQWHKELTG